MNHSTEVNSHYGQQGLRNGILSALESAGKNLNQLTIDDLTPLEEFHIGGRRATLDLAERAGISPASRVLDLGCGIGGPARALAHHFDCTVVGVDLTEEFCDVGRILTELTGLNDLITIHHGSALEIPADDNAFDVVWIQHLSMNIESKESLAAEVARVTRPGGTLALHEVAAGSHELVHYPVPWASSSELNFLLPAGDLEAIFAGSGFRTREWTDVTSASTEWFRGATRRLRDGEPLPLSLIDLMGDRFPLMTANLLRNLEEGRATVVRGVLVLEK